MNCCRPLLLIVLCTVSLVAAKKVSIITPCHARHVTHLDGLIKQYERQTMMPDEMVISLSEINQKLRETVDRIADTAYAFPVTLIVHSGKLFAGQNRNAACSRAIGDIFICQDADDIPHPQRVKIIHHFFCKYDLDHLLHQFRKTKEFTLIEDISSMETIYPERHSDWFPGKFYAQGTAAISKELFSKVRWRASPLGEDTYFNQTAYKITEKRLLLPYVLYFYRTTFSLMTHQRAIPCVVYYPRIIDGDSEGTY